MFITTIANFESNAEQQMNEHRSKSREGLYKTIQGLVGGSRIKIHLDMQFVKRLASPK
jgi:hypothetical protein